MAIQADQPGAKEEDDKNKQPIGEAPSSMSTGSAPAGGVGGAGAPQQQKGPSSSGAYTDVGKYVQANQPNIGKFAGNVAGQASQEVDQARTAFGQDAQKLESEVQGGVQNVGVNRTPSGVANAGDVNTFLKGDTYTGPQDSTSISTSGVQQAADLFNVAESPKGQEAFLQKMLGDEVKDYSAGERGLDSIFLNRDQGARDIIGQARTDANQAAIDAEARKQGINQAIEAARAQGATNRANVVKGLQDEWAAAGGEKMFDESGRYDAFANRLADEQYSNLKTKYAQDRDNMTQGEVALLRRFNTALGDPRVRSGEITARESIQNAAGDFLRNITGAGDATDDQYSQAVAGSNLNLLSGYNPEQAGRLQSLIDATQGTDVTDVYSGAQAAQDRGEYSADTAWNNLMNYLSSGPTAGAQDQSGGGNYVESSNNSPVDTALDTVQSFVSPISKMF